MQKYFLYLFLFFLSFVGCEIKGLGNILLEINVLIIFLSLSFCAICSINIFSSKETYRLPGKSEILMFLFLIWAAASFYFSVSPDWTGHNSIKCLGGLAFGLGLILYLKSVDQLNKIWLINFIFSAIHGASSVINRFFVFFLPDNLKYFEPSFSLFHNQNFYSTFLLVHIPVGLYLYFNASNSFEKKMLGLGWICILVALGFSDSLAGQLVAGFQILVSILYFLATKKPDRARLVALATTFSIFVYFLIDSFIPVEISYVPAISISSPEITGSWFESHVKSRMVYAWAGWKIFTEHWLTGSGLSTYIELYPFTGLMEVYKAPIYFTIPSHAHNFYIQVASETGVIGLGLLIACILFLIQNILNTFNTLDHKVRDLIFFLTISTFGYLVHNLIECNWLPSLFIYYFVLQVVSIGFLVRIVTVKNFAIFSSKILPVVLVISIFYIGITLSKYYEYNQIILRKVLESQSLNEVEQQLDHAKILCSRCGTPYYLSGMANLDEAKKLQSSRLIDKAQQEFDELIKRNPYNSEAYMIRGEIFLFQRNNQKAIESYKMAMRDSRYKVSARKKIESLERGS
jgi:hypothetical protein